MGMGLGQEWAGSLLAVLSPLLLSPSLVSIYLASGIWYLVCASGPRVQLWAPLKFSLHLLAFGLPSDY